MPSQHTLKGSFWNDKRIAELIRLIKNNVTCIEAARLLGTSKGAVIGKAYRLNLVFCSRDDPESEEKAASPINLDNIFPHKGCLWIEAPSAIPLREGMFCGAPVAVEGASWCPEHINRVYIKKAAA